MIKWRYIFKLLGQMSKPSDNKRWCSNRGPGEATTKGSFHHYHNSKNPQKKLCKKTKLHIKLIMALQLIWCVTLLSTFHLPTLCTPIRVFILGSQLTRWELFSTSVSERNHLLLLCVYILHYTPWRNIYLQILREMRLTNFLIVKQNRYIFYQHLNKF